MVEEDAGKNELMFPTKLEILELEIVKIVEELIFQLVGAEKIWKLLLKSRASPVLRKVMLFTRLSMALVKNSIAIAPSI